MNVISFSGLSGLWDDVQGGLDTAQNAFGTGKSAYDSGKAAYDNTKGLLTGSASTAPKSSSSSGGLNAALLQKAAQMNRDGLALQTNVKLSKAVNYQLLGKNPSTSEGLMSSSAPMAPSPKAPGFQFRPWMLAAAGLVAVGGYMLLKR